METITAPAPAATEAQAPQSTQVVEQTQVQTQTPSPEAPEGVQVDRGARLAEITELIAKKPETKLNDADLAIYEEGQTGKLKPAEKKEEVKVEKPEIKADDPIQKAMKDLGAKTPDEIPSKISELRKALSGKDAQAVAALTKEIEGYKAKEQAFTGTTRFIEDLKAGKPGALEYLQKELGVKLPSTTQSDKPFTEEDDILVGGALSRQWQREQDLLKKFEGLESKLTEGEKRTQQQQTEARAKSQIVDEILSVAELIPQLKSLPNLRNRIIDFQAGKEDQDLQTIADLSDMVISANKDKGLVLDLETAFYAHKGRNMAAEIAAAEERGRKEAYNHKPNKSLSSVANEETQPETFTNSQYEAMGLPYGNPNRIEIPDKWYTKGDLDPSKMPAEARKVFGYE